MNGIGYFDTNGWGKSFMKQRFASTGAEKPVEKQKTTEHTTINRVVSKRTDSKRAVMKSSAVIALTACLTLAPAAFPVTAASSAPAGAITAYAGPASETKSADSSSETGASGSGAASSPAGNTSSGSGSATGPAGSGNSASQTAQDGNYYNAGYSDNLVKPVDRYSYDQMSADMNALKAKYPNLVTLSSIGTTADGRQIYDIAIGNTGARRKILFQGAMHAREYIVVPLLMRQAENLLQGAANGGTLNGTPVSSLLQNMCIHFIPMTNPDGVSLSQWGLGGIGSEELRNGIQQMYAQDLAEGVTQVSFEEYLRHWKSNARGVDLNRNFDAGWAEKKTVEHPSNQGYKGTSPLSEAESRALADFIDREGFRAVINYHAMGDVIYWDTENNKETAVSLEFANLVHNANGYAIQSCDGVAGLKDWLQRRANSIPGITIEVGQSSAPVNFGEFPTLWEQNKMVPGLIAQSVMRR